MRRSCTRITRRQKALPRQTLGLLFEQVLSPQDLTASRQLKNFETSTFQCLRQDRRPGMGIYALLIPGVIIVPNERDVTGIHGLLLGPAGTPYEGGFFQCVLKCPPDYPAKPPLVKLLTTDDGRVRSTPNLNEDDMKCLSLLGTLSRPVMSSSGHSLRTVLIAL
ncbi:hypothetical protein MRX96_009019 [Rhipicephalus microplus]